MTQRFSNSELKPTLFEVDPNGGYLNSLPGILYPRQIIGEKSRGGSHVCLPNFGPDSSGRLAQHGFGRTSRWEVIADDSDDDEAVRVVELKLDTTDIPDDYEGLEARLQYWCGPDHLSMILTVLNSSESAMRVAPAFHPYFMADKPVMLNGELVDLSSYSEARFMDREEHKLQLGNRQLTLSSRTLNRWALWTDQLGEYFCVEPTLAGPSFDGEPDEEELVDPGRIRRYDFTIAWG